MRGAEVEILRVEGVSKRFDDKTALEDTSFKVKEGKILVS